MKALHIHYIFLIIWFGLTTQSVMAQDDWQQTLYDQADTEDFEEGAWEEAHELLDELARQPLDINSATREELESLPFLSDQQVEDIIAYRYRHGELLTWGELQMIPSLTVEHRQLLQTFTYIGHRPAEPKFPRLDSLWHWGKQEVTASLNIPFYKRKGDSNGYLGYPYKHTVRYRFNYGNRLQFGLLGAQDAGEPFFAAGNSTGYDHYAWYLMVRRLGRIEALAVGQYRLSFGMGLVMNGGFSFGKLTMLQNLGRATNAIRPNSSRMQSGYLQGAAVTIAIGSNGLPSGRSGGGFLTLYASCRPADGTLSDDGSVRTLLADGYHRTPLEMEKKHNLTQTDAGAHIEWRRGAFRLGATAAYTHLSRTLQPDTRAVYRRYYPAGSDFLNASVNYRYTAHRLSLSGETAIDGHGSLATVNSLSFQPSSDWSVMLLQRFYGYRYAALHARSFAEGSRTQNESGLYLGATWRPTRRLNVAAYTDLAYFAWPRYMVSASSYAWDNLLTASYTASRWKLKGRYRLHLRQRDNEDKTLLTNRLEHRARLALSRNYQLSIYNFQLSTQADLAHTDYNGPDWGFMVSQRVSWEMSGIKANAGFGYFHTDSYDTRLYLYERAPRYEFSFPMFYGEGIRYWLMVHATLFSRLVLTAKVGVTNYFDRPVIGTGRQQIDHSSMTDLNLQVTYKL